MRRTLLLLAIISLATSVRAGVMHVVLDGAIHPITYEFIGRALDQAARNHDQAVLLELRTPGGLEESTREIIQRIVKSPVPVIVFVSPSGSRAASAGFYILESADVAAMAPGTNTGAAHPVILGTKMDDVMKMKLENDSAAFMRSVAAKRGRNVAVAESAVRESKSFTEQEALAQHLIDIVAPDATALLKAVNGRAIKRFDGSATILHLPDTSMTLYEMSQKEKLMSALMDPDLAFILLALGALALWAEFSHPGAVLPGVVGLIAITLSLFALNLLPTRFASLALLIVAFALFALEAKFATHGILAVGGVVSMVIGALFLVDGPIPEMRVHLMTALLVSIPLGMIAVFLMTLVLRTRRGRVVTGGEGMIGQVGVARTPISADGKVFVRGELWNAFSARAIDEGTSVRVSGVRGLHLDVEPVDVREAIAGA